MSCQSCTAALYINIHDSSSTIITEHHKTCLPNIVVNEHHNIQVDQPITVSDNWLDQSLIYNRLCGHANFLILTLTLIFLLPSFLLQWLHLLSHHPLTPNLFHFWLKTNLFHKSFHHRLFSLSLGLTPRFPECFRYILLRCFRFFVSCQYLFRFMVAYSAVD